MTPPERAVSAGEANYILIVDDDQPTCYVMALVLAEEGYEVIAFTDPVAALSRAKDRPPGLILLDIRMPTMDGARFVEAYRALPNSAAPIVVCTAVPNAEEYATRFGAVGALPKPFNLDDLLAVVNHAFELSARGLCCS